MTPNERAANDLQNVVKVPEPVEKARRYKSEVETNGAAVAEADEANQLPLTEVVRRLRALEQPVTLFGEVTCIAIGSPRLASIARPSNMRPAACGSSSELCALTIPPCMQDDAARRERLKMASVSLQLMDEQKGRGQQKNTLLELQRAQKSGKGRPTSAGEKKPPAEAKAKDKADAGPTQVNTPTAAAKFPDRRGRCLPLVWLLQTLPTENLVGQNTCIRAHTHDWSWKQQAELETSTSGRDVTQADGEEEDMMAAFTAAADAVKAQRAEAAMCTEDRILKHLKVGTV